MTAVMTLTPAITPRAVVEKNSTQNVNVQKRIRIPHDHDVLCGRGGGINSHLGNKTFRKLVQDRKESYNLAHSKIAKADVSREIMEEIARLKPPGRFLMREEIGKDEAGKSPTYWVEIDFLKAMAKTSQALREGAPAIRAKYRDNPGNNVKSIPKKTNSFPNKQEKVLKKDKEDIMRAIIDQRNNFQDNAVLSSMKTAKFMNAKRKKELDTNPRPKKLNPTNFNLSRNSFIAKLGGNFIGSNFNKESTELHMTEEERIEKSQLNPAVPLLSSIPINPTGPTMISDNSGNLQNGKEQNFNATQQNTPNLLPTPHGAESPDLTSFLLPSSSISSIPLVSVFSKSPPIRSHSLALSDLPEPETTDQSYLHQEPLLMEDYDDGTFHDIFSNDKEDCWGQLVEGNPDLSATRLHSINKIIPSDLGSRSRSFRRALSQSSIRTFSFGEFCNTDESLRINKRLSDEKKSVCFCLCDGHDGAVKELCPCNFLANSLLKGELEI